MYNPVFQNEMHDQDQRGQDEEGNHICHIQVRIELYPDEYRDRGQSESQGHVEERIEVLLDCLLLRVPVKLRPEDVKKDSQLIDKYRSHQDENKGKKEKDGAYPEEDEEQAVKENQRQSLHIEGT